MVVRENLLRVQERIHQACARMGRDPQGVKLVAVSKTVSLDLIREALACGLGCFGENYVQEAVPKIRELGTEAEWHFIGRLQTNKVRQVVGKFSMIHAVDRLSLAREIDRRAQGASPVPVLIQVNIAGEATKSGIPPEGLEDLLDAMAPLPNLRVRGLMTMPPFFDAPERVRPFFRSLREIREKLLDRIPPPHTLEHLSMGMTGDFEVAIEEGATIVRIGTALFGSRPS